jgi:hypothetical protein
VKIDHDKVKVTFNCSPDERACIKILAAKAHMNISELLLSYIRPHFPKKQRKPNKKTLAAHQEILDGGGTVSESLEDFWSKIEVN